VIPKGASLSFPFQRSFRYYISIFAGTDLILNEPRSIFKDLSGNLYIASTKHHKVYKVDTSGIVSIIAGTGDGGDTGDGGEATLARLNEPSDVYKDSSGNIYIADTNNHKIRKVDASGIISTIAGTGDAGDTGDNGAATLARLNEPRGVFIDSSGSIYIADTKNHKIRWINSSGKIRPIAGTGTSGDAGDGGDALSALLNEPSGIFKDATDFYIADTNNHKIRKVNAFGIISTFAGTGTSGDAGDGGDALSALLDEPRGVFKNGTDLYIADTKNHKIRKVNLSTNIISRIAGTGDAGNTGDGAAATSARLNEPNNMVLFSGELYIADTKNHIIRKVDTSGDISTIVGGGVLGDDGFARLARLNEPNGIFKDDTDLYIADTRNHRIRKIDLLTNIITTVAGTGVAGYNGDGISATLAQLNEPRNVLKATSGNLYIADTKNHRIRKVDTSGNISTFAGTGSSGDGSDFSYSATSVALDEPYDVMIADSYLYIADTKNHKIRRMNAWGWIWTIAGTGSAGDSGDGGAATSAELDEPQAVSTDMSGNLYIADTKNDKIRKVDTSGDIWTVAGTGDDGDIGDGNLAINARFKEPVSVFVDHNSNIFIVDRGARRIRVVNAGDEKIYHLAGTGDSDDTTDLPAVLAKFKDPAGITMATSYGGSQIFISDTGNHKIKVLEFKTVYGL
jgi:BRCT domain type II-containing protein